MEKYGGIRLNKIFLHGREILEEAVSARQGAGLDMGRFLEPQKVGRCLACLDDEFVQAKITCAEDQHAVLRGASGLVVCQKEKGRRGGGGER